MLLSELQKGTYFVLVGLNRHPLPPALCAGAHAPGTKPRLYLCLLIPITACLGALHKIPGVFGSPYVHYFSYLNSLLKSLSNLKVAIEL